MSFWATGDENPYQTGVGGQAGYEKDKALNESFARQMAANEKAKGTKTPGYDKSRADIMALYDARKRLGGPAAIVAAKAGYTAPTGPGAKFASDSTAMLGAASQGDGPSVSKAVMGQGVDDALRNRQAALAAGKPTALAQQAAMGAMSGALSQSAASSAAAKAQEVQSATSQYGAALGAMRGADLATAQGANRVALANAQMAQQAGLQNQKAQMDWYAMSDAEKNAILGMAQGLDQNEFVNALNYYNFTHGIASREEAQSMRDSALRGAQYGQWMQGAAGGVGYAAQAWAENQKNTWDDPYGDLTR